jgi:thiamine-monophosphate kinase
MMNEFSFIEYLRKKVGTPGRVSVGIGDDAAVLSVAKGKQLVVSTDVIVENVDFICRTNKGARHNYRVIMPGTFMNPKKIGRKALAVNLSDIAAMGVSPTAFVISVGRPPYVADLWLKRFYDGLLALAKQYDVACVGGDFSSSREFFASITIFGEALPHQIVKRSGARAGDWIAVTGFLGGSILRHHYDFEPRVREGKILAREDFVSAMIDISDGLVQDLSHILKASKVGAVLDLDKIPVSSDAKKIARAVILRSGATKNLKPGSFAFCKAQDDEALLRALSDGEDFELLFTVPPWQKMMLEKVWRKKFPRVPLAWIGKIEGKMPRISWRQNGVRVPAPELLCKGFSHF